MAMTRIKEHREAAGLRQEQLAEAVGVSVSQISRFERGEREPRLNEIIKIGQRLGVRVAVLIGEEDEPAPVAVIGKISAGGSIDTSREHLDEIEPLYQIEAPFDIGDDVVAYEVDGVSMWPRYDPKDIVICSRQARDVKALIGFEAAVATEDGRYYLKRILKGSRIGLYNLESHNAEPIRDVGVLRANEVITVIRACQVRTLTSAITRSRSSG